MTVGELRRVLEPLADEAEVLLPTYEHPTWGAYRKTARAAIEAVEPQDDAFVRARDMGQAQAALVIR